MKTKDELMHDQLNRLYNQQTKLLCSGGLSSRIMLKVVNRQIKSIENYFERKNNNPKCYPLADKINCKNCPEFNNCEYKKG